MGEKTPAKGAAALGGGVWRVNRGGNAALATRFAQPKMSSRNDFLRLWWPWLR